MITSVTWMRRKKATCWRCHAAQLVCLITWLRYLLILYRDPNSVTRITNSLQEEMKSPSCSSDVVAMLAESFTVVTEVVTQRFPPPTPNGILHDSLIMTARSSYRKTKDRDIFNKLTPSEGEEFIL